MPSNFPDLTARELGRRAAKIEARLLKRLPELVRRAKYAESLKSQYGRACADKNAHAARDIAARAARCNGSTLPGPGWGYEQPGDPLARAEVDLMQARRSRELRVLKLKLAAARRAQDAARDLANALRVLAGEP